MEVRCEQLVANSNSKLFLLLYTAVETRLIRLAGTNTITIPKALVRISRWLFYYKKGGTNHLN